MTGQRVNVDRASSTDLAFLAMDRGEVPEQFGVLLRLDPPGLDLATLRDLVGDRIAALPRLRRRLVAAPPGCGRAVWVDDPGFDLARQVRAVPAPDEDDDQALLDAALAITRHRLPRDRPLWAITLCTGPRPAPWCGSPVRGAGSARSAPTWRRCGRRRTGTAAPPTTRCWSRWPGRWPRCWPGEGRTSTRCWCRCRRPAGHDRGRAGRAGQGAGPPGAGRGVRAAADRRPRRAVPPAGRLGGYHYYMRHQRRFHTLVSHVRGPDRTLTLGGCRVVGAVPVGVSDGGNTPVCFQVLSYAGSLNLTVIVDPDAFADLDGLIVAVRRHLRRLTDAAG